METWQGDTAPSSRSSASAGRPRSTDPAGSPGSGEDGSADAAGRLDEAGIEIEIDEAEIDEAESELAGALGSVELDAAERERMRAERRRFDQLVVEAVLEEGLGGPRHRALEDQLIRYAVPVLQYLLATGQLVSKATRLGRPPVPADAWLDFTADDRQEFAQDMVATALPVFTRAVFEQRRWTPDRGASLTTYFVNACALQFARLQEKWLDDRKAVRPSGLEVDPDAVTSAPDPAITVALQDEAHRMLSMIKDEQIREVLVLRGAGWTAEDAAREAGLTTKAAEGRLARIRKSLKDGRARTEPHAPGGRTPRREDGDHSGER